MLGVFGVALIGIGWVALAYVAADLWRLRRRLRSLEERGEALVDRDSPVDES